MLFGYPTKAAGQELGERSCIILIGVRSRYFYISQQRSFGGRLVFLGADSLRCLLTFKSDERGLFLDLFPSIIRHRVSFVRRTALLHSPARHDMHVDKTQTAAPVLPARNA